MQEVATCGAGCFWGVEAAFRRTPGVNDTAVGYSGGDREQPTYKDVCTDETGHAEVVQVTFDPQKLSYSQLLDVFWKIHDPGEPPRAGFREAIPHRYLFPFARAGRDRSQIKAGAGIQWKISPSNRHGSLSGKNVLAGGRVSSAVSGQARSESCHI